MGNLFKKSAIILGLKWSLTPLDFLAGVIVARSVGPEGKGILMLIAGLVGSILAIANFGVPYGAAYLFKKKIYSLGKIITSAFLLTAIPFSVAFMVLGFFLNELILLFFSENISFQTSLIWIPLMGGLLGVLSSSIEMMLIKKNEMKLYSIKKMGASIINIGLTFLLVAVLSLDVAGALWSQFFVKSFGIVIIVYWIKNTIAYTDLRISKNALKEIFRAGIQRYTLAIVTILNKRMDTFIIASFLSIENLGIFSIAWGLHNLLRTIPGATMWPLISELTEDKKNSINNFAQMSRIQFSFMLLVTIFLGPLFPLLIELVYGQSFLPAKGAIWAMLPSVFLSPFLIVGNAYFASRGESGRIFLPMVFASIIQLILSLYLVPKIGFIGAAVSISVNTIIVSSILLNLIVRLERLSLIKLIFMNRNDWMLIRNYLKKMYNKGFSY